MRHNYHNLLKILVLCLFFQLFSQFAAAQNNAADKNILINFEKGIEQGKIDEIESPLLNYAIAHPAETKALELLAQVRFQQGRFQEAKGLNQRVLSLNPAAVSARINLGRATYFLGEKDEARAILNGIAEAAITAPKTKLELASGLFQVGEVAKALTIIDKLPANLKSGESLPLIAAIYLESGNKQKLNGLLPLMKISSINPILAVHCAEILQNAKMNLEALSLLKAALVSSPSNGKVLVTLGRLEIERKDYVSAKQHLKRAEELLPRSTEVLSAKALLENVQGNLAVAFEILNEARQLDPNSTVVLSDFVIVAMRFVRPQAAVDAAKTLVAINPANPEFQYLLGAALLQSGNIAAAQETLERFTQQRPNDSQGCLALGLTLAAQTDKLENARRQLNHCLEIDPANFEAKYQLGLSYKAQGDTAKAIQYLEDVEKLAPNYALSLRDLGTLYLQNGNELKARSVLERSVAINPKDADTHFQLSRLYNLIGESNLAKQHFEAFQKLKNPGEKSNK